MPDQQKVTEFIVECISCFVLLVNLSLNQWSCMFPVTQTLFLLHQSAPSPAVMCQLHGPPGSPASPLGPPLAPRWFRKRSWSPHNICPLLLQNGNCCTGPLSIQDDVSPCRVLAFSRSSPCSYWHRVWFFILHTSFNTGSERRTSHLPSSICLQVWSKSSVG